MLYSLDDGRKIHSEPNNRSVSPVLNLLPNIIMWKVHMTQQYMAVRKEFKEPGRNHVTPHITCSNAYDLLSLESGNFTWPPNMIISTMTQPVIITLSPASKSSFGTI
jgi:hypothetical protein